MSSRPIPAILDCCHVVAGIPDVMLGALGSAAIVSVFGVIGYWVKAHFDRKSQKELFERNHRQQIYESFMMLFVGFVNSPPGSDEMKQVARGYVECRAKILLHGSDKLMSALNELPKFAVPDSPQAWDAFRKIALCMRADLGFEFNPEVEKFSKLLFAKPGTLGSKDLK